MASKMQARCGNHNDFQHVWLALLFAAASLGAAAPATGQPPIALHPDNPHYFLFRGKPTVLITSGEHYGAVINLDFDYVRYLDELQRYGLNQTRTFSGAYVESPKSFNITENTLAPKPNRFICPWARSNDPGYANGGNKFDLTRWDEKYFARLKDFVAQAGRRGVVVELVLFCPYYREEMWELSPLKASNNINGVGDIPRTAANTLKNGNLLAVQEAMVRKIVTELNPFDNVYYEICNEPYAGRIPDDWQAHIASIIVETEKNLPHKHLIAQNIANGSKKIENPNPAVSIFNFHYATPPVTVGLNYHLNKVIADDETGFKGTDDRPYRTEGWDFILAGGGVYSNLDYSFTVGREDGTFQFPPTQPGGGGRTLRRQLQILAEFINSFDFIRMKPDNSVIVDGVTSPVTARALVETGRAYAVYVRGGKGKVALTLDMPEGRYRAEWLNTKTGQIEQVQDLDHAGGNIKLSPSPEYVDDVALRIRRIEGATRR
ncbi:MAG: hypothetical protein N3D11_14600 [Candidatus Sumerlaeia bacterium]|nr:hypothetical protein [Candidatus Sumerlaeia bacterium]